MYPIPFPHSYWVVPGKLLAGQYPGSQDPGEMRQKLAGLVDVGIRHVINLQEVDERNYAGDLFEPYETELQRIATARHTHVTVIRMPIRDAGIPSREQMRAILDEIDRSLARDLPVYVHCWGGKGRTGTVVGCYLARHGIATGKSALDKINELRRNVPNWNEPSPETRQQCEMVALWQIGE